MRPWTLVDRDTELAHLAEVSTNRTARGLVFAGPAGVGRSRLLREGLAALDANQFTLLCASAGQATADLPLGGLSAVLPAARPAGISAAGLLRWAADQLQEQACGRPIVLAIDDAHLLDPLSAALVYHLAHTRHATVIGTVRASEPVPAPIRALWTEHLLERIELGPIGEPQTAQLLEEVLGGPVDPLSVNRFWHLSEGNPLLLRELVIAAECSGEIVESYGVWSWTGRLTLTATLIDVIDARIGELTPEIRTVLELVAFGEPIGLPLLAHAAEQAAVEAAEERQLIRVLRDDRRVDVRLAHPLHGEAIRQRCPVTRSRRLLTKLAQLVARTGARRSDDALRIAVWRLDSDSPADVGQLLAAARQAFARYDLPLAQRLSRAALAADGGSEAAELLATVLHCSGEPEEALTVLDSAADPSGTARRRGHWLGARACVSYWGLADESTPQLLAESAGELTDASDRGWIRALEGRMRLHHGELAEADRLAAAVLGSPASSPPARALASCTRGHLQAVRGAPTQVLHAMTGGDADETQWRSEEPQIQLAMDLTRGTAAILAGELAAIDTAAATEVADLVEAGDVRLGSGYLTILRAQAARLRGQLASGARWAGQATTILADSRVYGALAHAERAHIAALAGEHGLAADAMAEADRAHRPTMTILYPWLETARCWVAGCAGDIPTALDVLGRLLVRLNADGLTGHEAFALHDLVRLGHPDKTAADRLGELACAAKGAFVPIMAWHARAAADHDGAGLLAAAAEFADSGLTLYAAEAAATGVALLRAARAPQTLAGVELLADLLTDCAGACTPALAVPQPTLTSREWQIARLAAAGVPSKEIADDLYLSARTVDNHLLRVYAKLGVGGRADLGAVLRTVPPDPQRRPDS